MENIAYPITIPKKTEETSDDDFFKLIQQAIRLAQEYSYHKWTDYNLHDPGVTILEQLCFSVSDIFYRLEFPIEDLLTSENGLIDYNAHSFIGREKVLTSNPVTIADLRKSLLDSIDEIDNIYFTPLPGNAHWGALNGLYKVSVQLSENSKNQNSSSHPKSNDILEKIRKHYVAIRNLGEDILGDIEILQPLAIKFRFKIEIPEISQFENVLLQIIETIRSYFNPGIKYQSREDATRKGLSSNEFFDGPLLKHGFISENDMPAHAEQIDVLQIINLLNKIPGIKFIQLAEIVEPAGKLNVPISIPTGYYAEPDINFLVKNIQFTFHDHAIKIPDSFLQSIQRKLPLRRNKPGLNLEDSNKIQGKFRNPGVYHSIQNYFPALYGIGKYGFNKNNNPEFAGVSNQLKAYLYFMEQLLANFLKQIAHLEKLYGALPKNENQSYAFELNIDIPGLDDLIKQNTILNLAGKEKPSKDDLRHSFRDVLKFINETSEVQFKRKNTILDHLLARFNIRLNLTPVYHHFKYYGPSQTNEREERIIQWKNDLLQSIPLSNYYKFRGLNYTAPEHIAAINERIARYLYLDVSKSAHLTNGFQTGKVALFQLDETKRQNNFKEIIENIIWNSETYKVIVNSDEVLGQADQVKLLAGGIQTSKLHLFLKRGKSIFKHGIEKSHYRIIPLNTIPTQVLLIFSAPEDEYWQIVSRHNSTADAEKALHSIISQLLSINIESEGFHLVEHHLLRPSFESPVFGYRFLIGPDVILFENTTFSSYATREAEIQLLLHLNNSDHISQITAPPNFPEFKIRYYPTDSPNTPIEISSASFFSTHDNRILSYCKTIGQYLDKLSQNKRAHYPKFEFNVRIQVQTIIPEYFFSQRLSFLFPSWTARFQEPEFREFAHSLITSQAPAHLKSKVLWLSISQMTAFEKLYTLWKQDLSTKNLSENSYSESLALLLYHLK